MGINKFMDLITFSLRCMLSAPRDMISDGWAHIYNKFITALSAWAQLVGGVCVLISAEGVHINYNMSDIYCT